MSKLSIECERICATDKQVENPYATKREEEDTDSSELSWSDLAEQSNNYPFGFEPQ